MAYTPVEEQIPIGTYSLHLVEKYADREIAILIAKYFAIDIDRDSQTAFSIFKGQKTHQDEAVKKAQEYIERKIEENYCRFTCR